MAYYLREIARVDISEINKWRNDRQIVTQLGSPFRFINYDTDDSWFTSYLGSRCNNIRLVIVCKTNDKIIGAVYLTGIDWVVRSAEFSIWIGCKDYQGKGAGKFATQEMLRHAFNDLGLNRVQLTVLSENDRALGLYRSCGFSVEGIHRQAAYKGGNFIDLIQMSMLQSEFISRG